MTDPAEPRLIEVPGPHAGADWRASALPGATAPLDGDGTGLRLVSDPDGPLRLDSRDGSLGRLTLPANVAVDDRLRVYLLDPATGVVRRYDPGAAGQDPAEPFRLVPLVGNDPPGGPRVWWDGPRNPRRVWWASGIAADRGSLYVADALGRRVLAFALDTWALREAWRFPKGDWPVDVVAAGGAVHVLTPDRVYRGRPDARPRPWIERGADNPVTDFPWSRLAVDTAGRVYVLPLTPDGGETFLQVFDPKGRPVEPVRTAAAVRDRFRPPAVFTVPDEDRSHPVRYVVPEPLTRPCGRAWPAAPRGRPAEAVFARVPRGAVVVDVQGKAVDPTADPPSRSRLFASGMPTERGGDPAWVSRPLDSKLFRCNWDAVEVRFADLPPGTRAEFSTYTADEEELPGSIGWLPEDAWADGLTVTGPPRAPDADPVAVTDFLVDSPPGRYLWLRVRFRGDGFATPVLAGVSVRFPRRSYLEHLPAVFSEDDAGRRFLERFLGVFQAEWDRLEDDIDTVPRLFDPAAAPAKILDRLAEWLGASFPPGASEADKRRFLAALPKALFAPRQDDEVGRPGGTHRGTPAALRQYLAAVLPEATWPPAFGPAVFPLIVDGFRDRDQRFLPGPVATDPAGGLPGDDPDPDFERAGPGRPLWGPQEVGRFQLGVSSRLDEERLVPAGPPELDVFAARAHRFRVVLPAGWVDTPAGEAAVRRVIEAEKPAHTAYELDLIRPGVRVGVQSTVGVDTILGGPPPGLGPAGPRLGADPLPPHGAPPAARLDAGQRLGADPARI